MKNINIKNRNLRSWLSILKKRKFIDVMKTFNEILASIILAVCVMALVYVVICVLPSKRPNVQLHEYRYVMAVDSTGNLTDEAKNQADSLITIVKHHERSINEHYDYILQQKNDDQKLYTVIGTILSIVVAIFGFFGYKNFKSIEEKAIVAAKDEMQKKIYDLKKIQENALTKLQEECLQNTHTETTKQFLKFKEQKMKNTISDMLNDRFSNDIESKLEKIDNLECRVDSLENSQLSIIARVDELHQDTGGKNEKSSISSQKANNNEQDASVIDMINNHDKNRQTDNE